MRSIIRTLCVAAFCTLGLFGLAACGGGSSSSGGDGSSSGEPTGDLPSEVSVVVPQIADRLDPRYSNSQLSAAINLSLEPLLRLDGKDLKPNLATAWEEKNPTTYSFTLRDGVTFWDGSPLTAEDVIYSFEIHMGEENESQSAFLWADAKSVKETGPNTITVKLSQPNPQFAMSVAQTGIVSKKYSEENLDSIGNPNTLNMGTGPYEFVSFQPSTSVSLRRYEDYWGKPEPFEKVQMGLIGDDSQRLLALQSGERNGIFFVPLTQISSIESLPDVNVQEELDFSIYKFNFDLEKEPWNDPHLQRAFAHTVNTEAIAEGTFGGNAVPAVTLTPPSIMSGLVGEERTEEAYAEIGELVPDYDLELAKKEMAKSSVPNGVSVDVLVIGSDPNLSAIAQTVAQDAAKVGIDIKVRQVDDNTYYNAIYFDHSTDGLNLEVYSATAPDPSNIIANAISSNEALPDGSGLNISNYQSELVDESIDGSKELAADDPERGELLIEAQMQAAKDGPFVPVVWPKVYSALNGMTYEGWTPFWWLSDWPRQLRPAN